MTDFKSWCGVPAVTPINGHTAAVLISSDDEAGIEAVAMTLPEKYATAEKLAIIADNLGKPKVSDFLRNRFPVKASSRSGDLGEILASAYVEEEGGFTVGPSRLIDRDHQEWAMRGDDVLGAKLDTAGNAYLAKVEAKSRKKMTGAVVEQAREGLQRQEGLPYPQSLSQFAYRLLETPDQSLGAAVLLLQLDRGVRPKDVTHFMFLFTTNAPSEYIEADLTAYAGGIKQQTVTLLVSGHQKFIRKAYEKALSDGA
jgi:hypothetical protein